MLVIWIIVSVVGFLFLTTAPKLSLRLNDFLFWNDMLWKIWFVSNHIVIFAIISSEQMKYDANFQANVHCMNPKKILYQQKLRNDLKLVNFLRNFWCSPSSYEFQYVFWKQKSFDYGAKNIVCSEKLALTLFIIIFFLFTILLIANIYSITKDPIAHVWIVEFL